MTDRSDPARSLGAMRWRGWLGAFLVASAAGLAALALAAEWGSFGYALVVLVPFCVGWALGFGTLARAAFKVALAVAVLIGLSISAMTLDLAGMLCTLILAVMCVLPLVLGGVVGHLLRSRLERSGRRARSMYSVVLFLPTIALLYGEARLGYDHGVEVVQTSRELVISPSEAWGRIAFYEDVHLEPPALARIGLPTPVRTIGAIDGVGARVTCVYEGGHLVKRITALEPGRLLAFDVVEQLGVEDRSIELIDGSFVITPTAQGVRVTLTTRFRPLLSARPFWRPFEHAVTRALHDHVLDGMALGGGEGS